MVGPERAVRAPAPLQSGAAEIRPRPRRRTFRARRADPRALCRSQPDRHRLRRRPDRRADAAHGLCGHSPGRLVREYRHGPRPRRTGRPRHHLSRRHGGADGGGECGAVRRGPDHGGDRARRRSRSLRPRLLETDQARRPDDRRHPEPHAEGPAAGQGRRRVRPALGPRRHPRLAPVPQARGTARHAGRRAPDRHRPLRAGL